MQQSRLEGLATHLLTPESETSCHDYFSIALPAATTTDDDVTQAHEAQKRAFAAEDKPMLAACQRMMRSTDLMLLHPVILPHDVGAIRARRSLAKLIRQERSDRAQDSPAGPDAEKAALELAGGAEA